MTAQVKAAEHREPLVRIAKRTDISRGKSWAIRAAAIVLALLLGALIMLLLGCPCWAPPWPSPPPL